jgi:hypothetical protein
LIILRPVPRQSWNRRTALRRPERTTPGNVSSRGQSERYPGTASRPGFRRHGSSATRTRRDEIAARSRA